MAGSLPFFDRKIIQWATVRHTAMSTTNSTGNATMPDDLSAHSVTFPAKSMCSGTLSGMAG